MRNLAGWIIAGALVAASGFASAEDTYYIQTGAFPTIGDISATGFFQTSGVGTDTVTGFDLTLRSGSQSVTLCTSVVFKCGAVNDAIAAQIGIVDTGSHLVCAPFCLLADVGEGSFNTSDFVFSSNAPYYANQYQIGGPPGKTADVTPRPGSYVIAGAKPAPEIDTASAAGGLALLVGGLLVLHGRRQRRRIAAS